MKKHPMVLWYLSIFVFISLNQTTNAQVEIYDYDLKFLMIPAVNIRMEIFSENRAELNKVVFFTNTYGLISKLLEVHNVYTTWYNKCSFSVKEYEKDIDQTNVKHSLHGNYRDKFGYFSNGKSVQLAADSVHNVFTTLLHLREIPSDSLQKVNWITEVEGKQYFTRFRFWGYENLSYKNRYVNCRKIEIIWKDVVENQKGVIGPTDVFSYEVVNPEGRRLIWIEEEPPNRIMKAAFSLSPFWLTADLKE